MSWLKAVRVTSIATREEAANEAPLYNRIISSHLSFAVAMRLLSLNDCFMFECFLSMFNV